MNFFKKYQLDSIVFLTGAIVMVMELAGSRALAPYVGTSIFVWTSLIGIILASLSLGYYLGGKIADATPTYQRLGQFIFFAGVCIGLVGFFHKHVLDIVSRIFQDVRLGATISTTILFAVPSVLLGMVSPYAVKLRMHDLEHSGSVVGNLSALSTLGSITGTFLTGFFLITHFGTTHLFFILAILLIAVSIFAYRPKKWIIPLSGILIFIAGNLGVFLLTNLEEAQGKITIQSAYKHIHITPGTDANTGRATRLITTEPRLIQSGMFLDNPTELLFDYTKFYHLSKHLSPTLERALMLGGAGYSYPKSFLDTFPNATIDVVEIDPTMTDVARQYFALPDTPRLTIIHEDGRIFLNRTNETYNVIYGDAFGSFHSIPHHLTTKEAAQATYDALDKNGVVLVNIISALEGGRAAFMEAEYHTYKEVFPHVYIFQIKKNVNTTQAQNLMLVALKSPTPLPSTSTDTEFQHYLSHLWTKPIPKTYPILTDEHAPVDQYIMKNAWQ